MFTISSEVPKSEHTGAFLVLIFEKQARKRSVAKSLNHKARLRDIQEMKRKGEPRFAESREQIFVRDLKSRRFANYFITLYDTHYIDPFTQFIKRSQVKYLKEQVKTRLELVLDQMNNIHSKPKDTPELKDDRSNDKLETPTKRKD